MSRILNMGVGVVLAAGASQFPEFSQQYVQRLGGAVDELEKVVVAFDNAASAADLTREEALKELSGTRFLDQRQSDMRLTIGRYERLSADYENLRGATAFERVRYINGLTDRELIESTWSDFEPAVPLTPDGFAFTGSGFLAGLFTMIGLTKMTRRRRRRSYA
ncbi:MAG: DUF2937 family protein [Pseudomonadota bacterium]